MKQRRGSYLLGIIGAIVGALLAAIPFVIVYHLGYIVFWLAALFVILASKGYDMVGGRYGYGKIPIIGLASLAGVIASIIGYDVWIIVSENIMAQIDATNADIPQFLLFMLSEDPEYRWGMLLNLGLSTLIVLVVWISGAIQITREVRAERNMAFHQEQAALHQEMYGDNGFNGVAENGQMSAPSGFQQAPAVSPNYQMNMPQETSFAQGGYSQEDNRYREEEISRPEE